MGYMLGKGHGVSKAPSFCGDVPGAELPTGSGAHAKHVAKRLGLQIDPARL